MVQLLQGGTVSQSYSYNAYGAINADEYGIRAPFYGYNGEEQNPFTGLQYLRARYYAPQNGGFITQDSFGGILTNVLSQNRYTYAENDPVNGIDPSGHVKRGRDDTGDKFKGGGGNKKDLTAPVGPTRQPSQTSRTSNSSGSGQSSKPPYTKPPAVPNSRRPMTLDHLPTNGARDALLRHAATSPGFKDNLNSQWEQYSQMVLGSGRPAAELTMQTLADPYFALGSTTGLAPSVIEDFAESARVLIRSTCNAQRQHYTAQLESQRAVDQAMLNIFGDAMNGLSDWWSRNGSTFMCGAMTTLIGMGTIAAAGAVAPIAALFGTGVLIVSGGVAILGVTDIVLGAVDMTAAITDDADLRAFVSSPGYTAKRQAGKHAGCRRKDAGGRNLGA